MAGSKLHLMLDYKRLLKTYDSGAVFCAVDTETTGIMLFEKNEEGIRDTTRLADRIIEIGAVKFNKDGIISTFDTLINPKKRLSPYITGLTHITDEMLKDKNEFSEESKAFLDFLGSDEPILIAHNASFDLNFINAELECSGQKKLKNHAADTLRMSRLTFPGYESYSLQNLASAFSIDVFQAHRANDDARVCMEIFKKCLEQIRIQKKLKASQ